MNTTAASFLFADIAGFTALTEAHGDEDAAALVAGFCDDVRRILPEYGAQHVKDIGDAVMLRVPEPERAIRLGLRLTSDLMRAHGSPAVRVGIHHGPAIERAGDYFGSTVNVAARVTGEAAGGEVLLTAATAEHAGELDGVLYESRGSRRLRNLREPVDLVAALHRDDPRNQPLVIDPVCRMAVDPRHADGHLVHGHRTYWFCSLACAAAFAREPETYLPET